MRVLHITDLHAGLNNDKVKEEIQWNSVCEAILTVHRKTPVDLVVVTGDHTRLGEEADFVLAEKYFNQLKNMLGFDAKQFFFCEGNHDADTQEAGSTFSRYEAFVKRFYGENGVPGQGVDIADEGQVFWLNSCKETSYVYYDDAVLDAREVDHILKEAKPEKAVVLLMHHQPEILDNQGQLKRLGESGKIKCLFTGHLHTSYTRKYNWKGLTVINGIALASHFEAAALGFQVVEVPKKGEVQAWMYMLRGDGTCRKYTC